ncbi:hypothetical protein PMAYCL1PPCAC_01548, partial [Pristionchus mayeri]
EELSSGDGKKRSKKEKDKTSVEATPFIRAKLPKEEKEPSSGDGKKKSEKAEDKVVNVAETVAEVKKEKETISTSSLPYVSSIPREYIRPFTDEEAWERYQKIKARKDLVAIKNALLPLED